MHAMLTIKQQYTYISLKKEAVIEIIMLQYVLNSVSVPLLKKHPFVRSKHDRNAFLIFQEQKVQASCQLNRIYLDRIFPLRNPVPICF